MNHICCEVPVHAVAPGRQVRREAVEAKVGEA